MEVAGANSGLKREQVGVAAAVEGHGTHLVAVDDFAHLAAGSLQMNGGVADCDDVNPWADLQDNIEQKGAVGVKDNPFAAVGSEAGLVDFENIIADGKDGESVGTAAVGDGGLLDARPGVHQNDGGIGDRCA